LFINQVKIAKPVTSTADGVFKVSRTGGKIAVYGKCDQIEAAFNDTIENQSDLDFAMKVMGEASSDTTKSTSIRIEYILVKGKNLLSDEFTCNSLK
jgi:hypothetical protein